MYDRLWIHLIRLLDSLGIEPSFPIIHKIFVLIKFENKMVTEICDFNYNSKHHDQCKFTLKPIRLLTVSNLFPFEVINTKKCQHCQLSVLRITRMKMKTTRFYSNYNFPSSKSPISYQVVVEFVIECKLRANGPWGGAMRL